MNNNHVFLNQTLANNKMCCDLKSAQSCNDLIFLTLSYEDPPKHGFLIKSSYLYTLLSCWAM